MAVPRPWTNVLKAAYLHGSRQLFQPTLAAYALLNGGLLVTYVVLVFVSVALLLAIVALLKERRLRLALQDVLRRLIQRWRSYAQTRPHDHGDRRNAGPDEQRV